MASNPSSSYSESFDNCSSDEIPSKNGTVKMESGKDELGESVSDVKAREVEIDPVCEMNNGCKRSENMNDSIEAGPSDVKEGLANPAASSSSEDSCSDLGPQACKREKRDEQRTDNEANSFPRLRSGPRNRRYRNQHSNPNASDEETLNIAESSDSEQNHEQPAEAQNVSSSDESFGETLLDLLRRRHEDPRPLDSDDTWSLINSDSDSDVGIGRAADILDTDEEESEENLKYQLCLQKEQPKHKWCVTKEVINRQFGLRTRQQEPILFWQHCYSSLHCVKRLELMYKLDEHHGPVNAIHFNRSGTLLASGSDDRRVIVWDWPVGRSIVTYASGHTSNIFEAKFLPLSGDTHMVTCARDGQVRLAVLSSTGECRNTRRVAHHRKPVNHLALHAATPHVFLSAGEDASVMSIDVRIPRPHRLLYVKEDFKRIGLYSADCHPLDNKEFCVSGTDHFIRIYDNRRISLDGAALKKFCPHHLISAAKPYTSVTCATYSYNGAEILGSYSDENIYVFDTRHSDGAEFVHKYEGHRNSATLKRVSFFGPCSEYIMSGSDCGNIFFWDKHTEAIVQFMRGDEKGVVNGLVGHPQFPILATVGLDSDIKVWVPSCEQDPELKTLRKVVINNVRDRVEDRPDRIDVFERTVWPQMRHIELRRVGISEQLRTRFGELDGDGGRSRERRNSSSDSSDGDSHSGPRVQCPQS